MTFTKPFTFFMICIMMAIPSLTGAAEVHLSVPASMSEALKKLSGHFKANHPDITLRLNIGSSGALARQIEQGAPADIFISANTRWMDYLIEKHLIDGARVGILAQNRLVFVGVKDKTVSSLADLTGLARLSLGSPQSVPAGQYAMEALTAAGIYQDLLTQNKLIMTKDVRQALLYADRGETDGAFVYATDALLAKHAVVLFTVPQRFHAPIVYPMALTPSGTNKTEARMVHDYLASPEAFSILTSFGFAPPATEAP